MAVRTKPKCIVITGRPGSGKTTLSLELSKRLHFPRISRDEIKEGYVNTHGLRHDELPEGANGVVNDIFFETSLNLLKAGVSVLIEAAFQHKVWDLGMPKIKEAASVGIILCELSAELSAKRHLDRGLADPRREFFHGDKRVAVFRETGILEPGEAYVPPQYPVPTLNVSTVDGYQPGLESMEDFVKSIH